jgi:hypothetical protein
LVAVLDFFSKNNKAPSRKTITSLELYIPVIVNVVNRKATPIAEIK